MEKQKHPVEGSVRVDAPKPGMILPADAHRARCSNCKFQQALGGAFGQTPMCVAEPPKVHVLVNAWAIIPPTGRPGDPFEKGGIRAASMTNEVRYPPAPDDWTCGNHKPRFTNTLGEVIR
jgi:hypothetical protein